MVGKEFWGEERRRPERERERERERKGGESEPIVGSTLTRWK